MKSVLGPTNLPTYTRYCTCSKLKPEVWPPGEVVSTRVVRNGPVNRRGLEC